MRFFGSALAAATFLFIGPIVALPTTAAAISLSDTLELLKDHSTLAKRVMIASTTPRTSGTQVPLCKLDRAKVPTGDGTTKLTDAGSQKLKLVVIGHGTQNYTCADSTANTKPVANGAHAELFDASCFASFVPGMLDWFPYLFLHKPKAIPTELLPSVGLHYFHPDATTPVFDVSGDVRTKKGRFVGKKLENVTAPAGANSGLAPDAFGAVDWLKLVNKDDVKTASGQAFASIGYKTVYRVVTAGGKPPATCLGRAPQFDVPYATQYWLYD